MQFTSTNERLAEGVRELVVGLGYRCGVSKKPVRGRRAESSVAFTISFSTDDQVFWLERKRMAHKERGVRQFTRRGSRFITEVAQHPVGAGALHRGRRDATTSTLPARR